MRTYEPKDRALIDLREARTDLAVRISLLKDSEPADESILRGLQRDLEMIDRRISTAPNHPRLLGATISG